jgi:aminopeptidase N
VRACVQVFDALSYQKGASVIRMLEGFIGQDKFRAGMQLYLKRHQYANATTVDLWNAIADASGTPLRDIMNTWTAFPGGCL